jgi:ABC-type multidrug transport system fused ATPase/permease subunit
MLALTGPSGSGKSTLAALVVGLIEPTEGCILVGGVPLPECDREHWRSSIAWMPQTPSMLRLSVMDNIRLGEENADDRRIREAARLAAADGFIDALPQGYDTLLGDGARALSAGQRQRIALARMFLRRAPLMVFDEPTANLDPAAARQIAASIDRLRHGRTILVITHDAGLAAVADHVVRLDAGRVLEPVLPGAA